MESRERVLAAINHEEPDRIPILLGPTNATGMKIGPYRELKKIFGIEGPDSFLYDWPELGTVLIAERIYEKLGTDFRGVLDSFPAQVLSRAKRRGPHDPFLDDWGSGQTEAKPGLWYPGIHPMADAESIDAIGKHPWPDPDDMSRYAKVAAEAARIAADGRFAILGCPWLLFPFERAHAMQGMDRFLENMAANPEFAEALLWKIESICERIMGHFLDEIGANIDIIKIGDDLGTQESLLISPGMYRRMLKPVHAEFIEFIKSRTRAKVLFHTDGDVFDLIPDLIEIGVDILNPIQSGAGKMSDLAALKKAYGKDLIFCGAIDTQKVLPFGSPAAVRAEVKRVMEILGPGGGYILSAVHTVMNEVPAENIIAMTEAAREFGKYPLSR